jgi:hypothetical protein
MVALMDDDNHRLDEIEPDAPTASALDNTGNLTPWKKGQSGNPKGRMKGSRNRLSDKTLAGLEVVFDKRGIPGLMAWANRDPGQFYKVCAAIIPRKLETSMEVTNIFAELNLTEPRDFAAAWDIAKQVIYGQGPELIENDSELVEEEAAIAWKTDGQD